MHIRATTAVQYRQSVTTFACISLYAPFPFLPFLRSAKMLIPSPSWTRRSLTFSQLAALCKSETRKSSVVSGSHRYLLLKHPLRPSLTILPFPILCGSLADTTQTFWAQPRRQKTPNCSLSTATNARSSVTSSSPGSIASCLGRAPKRSPSSCCSRT